MRWSIIRLIWHRELRDLARDRRWLFMLLGLPILLYPAFGLFGFVFASMMLEQPLRVGIHGLEHLPRPPAGSLIGPAAEVAWLAALPAPGGGIGSLAGAAASVLALRPLTADPPLVVRSGDRYQFVADFADSPSESGMLYVVPLASPDRAPLDDRLIDVLVRIPPDFSETLADRGA